MSEYQPIINQAIFFAVLFVFCVGIVAIIEIVLGGLLRIQR